MTSLDAMFFTVFFTPTTPPSIYTLSLHDALPIYQADRLTKGTPEDSPFAMPLKKFPATFSEDRKSTRLNSSHVSTSYAVFCLKKKMEPNNADNNIPRLTQ